MASKGFGRLFVDAQKAIERNESNDDIQNVFPVRSLIAEFLQMIKQTNPETPSFPNELADEIAEHLTSDDLQILAELYYEEAKRLGRQFRLDNDVLDLRSVIIHRGILDFLLEYGAESVYSYQIWQFEFTRDIVRRSASLHLKFIYDNIDEWEDEEFYIRELSIPTLRPAVEVVDQLHREAAALMGDKYEEFRYEYMSAQSDIDEEAYCEKRARGTLIINGVEYTQVRFF